MKNWKDTITEQLHTKMEGINEKDFRFYRVAEFERMINRSHDLSANCKICQAFKPEIDTIVETIDTAIQTPGRLRRNYDRLIDRMAKHQRREHQYFQPYYFTYNYSFFGMLTGSALGLLLGFVIFPEAIWYFILSGFVIGLLAARFWGARKDKVVRASGKLL